MDQRIPSTPTQRDSSTPAPTGPARNGHSNGNGNPVHRRIRMESSELALIRSALLKADPHCHYCRRRVCSNSATLDHVLPLAKGGDDRPSNLALCCMSCNQEKAGKSVAEFLDGRPILDVDKLHDKLNRAVELVREVAEILKATCNAKRDVLVPLPRRSFQEAANGEGGAR